MKDFSHGSGLEGPTRWPAPSPTSTSAKGQRRQRKEVM